MLNQQKWTVLLSTLVLATVLALTAWDDQISVVAASEENTTPVVETYAAQSEPGLSDLVVTVGRSVRAGDVLGSKVRNLAGDNIGQVEDIVVNLLNGQILFVTMSYDGGLFTSEKIYPVPVSAFSWDATKEELQLDLAEELLQEAPGFDRDWPDLTDPNYDREVYDYWLGVFPELPAPAETDPAELATIAKVSDIIGLEVMDPNDESLGEIADLIVNVEMQRVSTIVLNFESYTGFGQAQYVMPLASFTVDVTLEEGDSASITPRLEMSQSNLRYGPTFSDYVDLSDPNWAEPYLSWWQRMESNSDQPVTPLTLAGTAWQLASFGEIEDDLPVITGTRLTVNFLGERYGGYGGCDWFMGVYAAQADHGLRLQTPAQTRLGCEPAIISNQEATYMSSLLNILEYELKEDQLIGYAVYNQRLLTFDPVEPISFETTTWSLKLTRSETRWHAGIFGTEITAQFEGDQLSGSAGCNTYTATVDKRGNELTISDVTVTGKSCPEPDGIMTQEAEYLTLLQSVGSMTQVGGLLELADGEDQPMLLFGIKESD